MMRIIGVLASMGFVVSAVGTASAQVKTPSVAVEGSVKDLNGDDVQQGGIAYPSQAWDIRRGSAAAPLSSTGPIVKISKTENFTSAPNPVDNYNNAALNVQVQAIAGSKMQPNAILASVAGAPGADALAGSFLARHSGTNVNQGAYGLYSEGRTDNRYSRAIGGEFRSANYSGTARIGDLNSQSQAMGLWVTSAGTAGTGIGIGVGYVDAAARWQFGFAALDGSATIASFVSGGGVSAFYTRNQHVTGVNLFDGKYKKAAIVLPLSSDATGGINFGQQFNVFRDGNGGLQMPAKVGFGVLSVSPPTLPAALPTDGSASNAALSTAHNAIRSLLIANGLAR